MKIASLSFQKKEKLISKPSEKVSGKPETFFIFSFVIYFTIRRPVRGRHVPKLRSVLSRAIFLLILSSLILISNFPKNLIARQPRTNSLFRSGPAYGKFCVVNGIRSGADQFPHHDLRSGQKLVKNFTKNTIDFFLKVCYNIYVNKEKVYRKIVKPILNAIVISLFKNFRKVLIDKILKI